MLEKPDISDEEIVALAGAAYAIRPSGLTFLPLGADPGTAVYRLAAAGGKAYFLKLRKNFDDIAVTVPLHLQARGIQEILAPLVTTSGRGWVDFGEYAMILYPFIEGQDGFERELADDHRERLGAALRGMHNTPIPPELEHRVPAESFSPRWRERLRTLLAQAETQTFADATAANLAKFMRSRSREIVQLIRRTEELAAEMQARSPARVLCHGDIHGGNILISAQGALYIVDWDTLLLAPRERDLMFIGGGIDEIWKSPRDVAVFYKGYGEAEIEPAAMAYYRGERIVEDLAVTAEQLLMSDEGGADRERSYGWFRRNFEPGGTIEIAERTGASS